MISTSPNAPVIDVGVLHLDRVTPDVEILSPAEVTRSARMATLELRRRALSTRTAIRKVLSSYLSLHPRNLNLSENDYGKPRLADPPAPLHFNLSHSENVLIVAVCPHFEVGIDLEAIRPGTDWIEIARHQWGEPAAQRLSSLPPAAFFAEWTRYEAVKKASGGGLVHGGEPIFRSRTSGWDDVSWTTTTSSSRPAKVISLDLLPGFAAALACMDTPVSPRWQTVDWSPLTEE